MRILIFIYAVIFVAFATFTLHPRLRRWVDPVGGSQVQQGEEGKPHLITAPEEGPSVAWEKGPGVSDSSALMPELEHIECATSEHVFSAQCAAVEPTVRA
jgi:hypothetical protein